MALTANVKNNNTNLADFDLYKCKKPARGLEAVLKETKEKSAVELFNDGPITGAASFSNVRTEVSVPSTKMAPWRGNVGQVKAQPGAD